MSGRLAGKVAVVVGAGQTPGDTIGNGRATSILFAREGAHVVAVDRRRDAAEETVAMIRAEGFEAEAHHADATDEAAVRDLVTATVADHGRIDVLHNNVGIGAGDSVAEAIEMDAWDRIFAVNLKSAVLPCKHVLPVMRGQGDGSIVNVSSLAAVAASPLVAYKASKAALNAFTQSLAVTHARDGIRANAILPGLMDTPMAIEGIASALGVDRDELRAQRDAMVPLRHKMGTAWDVAHAALFLASDEARFVTGVLLPVDGGQSARVG